jgi:hypothetical protein
MAFCAGSYLEDDSTRGAIVDPALSGLFAPVCFTGTLAQNGPQKIGLNLYTCISINDASANSTFLVGKDAILLVDSGLNTQRRLKKSKLPIRCVINTHYHSNHQGGNKLNTPMADLISTVWTRQRTIEMLKSVPPHVPGSVVPATITFDRSLTIRVEPTRQKQSPPARPTLSETRMCTFLSKGQLQPAICF